MHMMEQVVLRNTRLSLYVHVSDQPPKDDEPDEVNLSHDRTRWLMKLYVDVDDECGDHILGGDYIRLFHVDREANVVHTRTSTYSVIGA